MNIDIKINQKMSITPQIRQAMEILQMGSQELLDYIQQLTVENPVVDVEESYDESDRHEVLKRKLEWLDSIDEQNRLYSHEKEDAGDDEAFCFNQYAEADENGLQQYLQSQLDFQDLKDDIRRIAEYLIGCIDVNGYLDIDIQDLTGIFKDKSDKVQEAVRLIQSFDPVGIGASDLKECLFIQLSRKGLKDSTAYKIIESCLELLSRNQMDKIAQKLGVTIDEVKAANNVIKTLNPKPGSSFNQIEKLQYVTPDIVVIKFKDFYEILLNDYFFPKISISGYYRNMLSSTNEIDVKRYISSKVKEAEWILKSIEQRNSTLINVTRTIVDMQRAFFNAGPGNLIPLVLKDIAQKLGIHESTVSRAVRDKYLQCSWGIYGLGYFFSNGLSASGETKITPDNIKILIKDIISGENSKKPYSDQKVTDILIGKGIDIKRRTVAKYREELNIPDTTGRKEF